MEGTQCLSENVEARQANTHTLLRLAKEARRDRWFLSGSESQPIPRAAKGLVYSELSLLFFFNPRNSVAGILYFKMGLI